MNEKLIEKKLSDGVKKLGGIAIKFYSAVHTGLPDRIVLMPGGRVFFVELKSTGKKPTKLQEEVMSKLTGLGMDVWVVDDQKKLDDFLYYILL